MNSGKGVKSQFRESQKHPLGYSVAYLAWKRLSWKRPASSWRSGAPARVLPDPWKSIVSDCLLPITTTLYRRMLWPAISGACLLVVAVLPRIIGFFLYYRVLDRIPSPNHGKGDLMVKDCAQH